MLVMAVLLGITLLLSGCVRIEADLDLRGPDRLALTWDVRSTQQRPLPWQEQFERDLQREVHGLKIEQTGPGRQHISSRVASSHDLAQQIQHRRARLANGAGEVTIRQSQHPQPPLPDRLGHRD